MGWLSDLFGGSGLTKHSDSFGVQKTESITSKSKPHEHKIVKVETRSGRVKETYVGENADRKELTNYINSSDYNK